MKKILLIVVAAATVLMLFACTKDDKGGNSQIPNPFIDCEDIASAEKAAGFTMKAPQEITGYSLKAVRAIENEMVELIWQSEDSELVIRKASGDEDISGDYNTYPENDTFDTEKTAVATRGKNSRINVAVWQENGYTYAVMVSNEGMEKNDLIELVKSIN